MYKYTQNNFLFLFLATFYVSLFFIPQAIIANPYDFNYSKFEPPWYYSRWVQHLLAAIFGGLFGLVISDKFKPIRRFLIIALIVVGVILAVVVNADSGNIVIFIVSAIIVWRKLKIAKTSKLTPNIRDTTLGSAQWADKEYIQKHSLSGTSGLSLGVFNDINDNIPLHYNGNRHLLTVAPTRSGKGVASIIPNLLTYQGSVFVIDPKGENARVTAIRRGNGDKNLNIEGMGQSVHIVDPWGITGLNIAKFNPLDWLQAGDIDINENAMMLADAIITQRSGNADPFWDEEAKALLMGILLYVTIDNLEVGNRHLGRVRDIITLKSEKFRNIMEEMAKSSNHIVSNTATRHASKDEKLRSSILASLQSHTHFLDSPRIRENLSASDFSFEQLKENPTSIYLVLPADRLDTFGRWLRLLVQQAITVNARNIHIKPEKPILFMLDEMASLGRLTMVEQAYGLMAGFGMQLWGIIQDLSQLEKIYDKGWQTFIGNSGVLQYFGSRDLQTADYFSKLCGVTTVEKFSITNSIAKAFTYATSNSSNTNTYSDSTTKDIVQRQLAYPDELMVMKEDREIIMIENFNPIKAQKVKWYENATLKKYGINIYDK
jgi:type IV secretion system protein VirD4